ncbi:MAG: hypothetical protein JXQ75_12205 [Phycisphaerae bacterium]|nr:hypothetical protein [Phycisphaerae bacterium]
MFICIIGALALATWAFAETMVTNAYFVQSSILDFISDDSSRESVDRQLQDLFSKMGIPFPEGSSITHDRALESLVMVNTVDNQEHLDAVLGQSGRVLEQVEVVLTVFRASQETTELVRKGTLLTPQLLASLGSNDLVVVATISGVALAGVEAKAASPGSSITFTGFLAPDGTNCDVLLQWAHCPAEKPEHSINTSVYLSNHQTIVLLSQADEDKVEFCTLTLNLLSPRTVSHRRFQPGASGDGVPGGHPAPDR